MSSLKGNIYSFLKEDTIQSFKSSISPKRLNPYIVFFLSCLLASLVLYFRIHFSELFGGNKNTYIIFYPSVMILALSGGFIAGITATIIFAFGSAFFLLSPINNLLVLDPFDHFGIIIFTITGIFISYICEKMHITGGKAVRQSLKLQSISKELQEAKGQLQTILENVADGIVVRDSNGTPIYANAAAREYFEVSKAKNDSFINLENIESLFSLKDEHGMPISKQVLPVYKVLHGAKQAQATVCFVNKKTGKEFWNISRSKGIYTKEGKLQFIVTVFADITDRRKIEKQKDDFLGIVSHELKTPVTSLKVYTQTLQQKFVRQKNEEASEKLKKMDIQVNKLTSLIADLLDITKLQTGKLLFQNETFDFNELIEELIEETKITSHKHRIEKNLDTTVILHTDRKRVGQVLMNLITNAIKYSPNANRIIITTKKEKNKIVASVQDFGDGIPKEKQRIIFNRYYREMGPKEYTIPGLGLGLYISSEFIKQLGGEIWVKSIKGDGATFFFSLPLKQKVINN